MTLPWLTGLGPVSSQELLKLGKGGGRGCARRTQAAAGCGDGGDREPQERGRLRDAGGEDKGTACPWEPPGRNADLQTLRFLSSEISFGRMTYRTAR